MNNTQRISVIAIFSALAIATDYAMMPLANVKLVFTLTFSSAYAFGFKVGAAVAISTELLWGFISPNGFGGLIIPFLVGANLIYAIAGYGASRIWGHDIKPYSHLNMVFGSILAVCAFLWDTATNFGTAVIMSWPNVTFERFLLYEGAGIIFMVPHEIGDFVIGSALAPVIIVYFLRVFGVQRREVMFQEEQEAAGKTPITPM